MSVVQLSMRVTRRIVLTLLIKALYKSGCFKEKVWSSLKLWIWQRCYFTKLPRDDFAWSVDLKIKTNKIILPDVPMHLVSQHYVGQAKIYEAS